MDEKNAMSLDAWELQKYQPNRYPFLLIDRVTEVIPGKSAKGYKNMTNNEWYMPVHFEGCPNMPGALQIETMAQMLTVAITTTEGMAGKTVHSYKHSATFHIPVTPGDRLDLEATVLSFKRGLCKGNVKGYIDGELACELDTVVLIPEEFNKYKPKGEK
jgi:3-hydroxyacyl-[acyl-carrier-protein] dehydratase